MFRCMPVPVVFCYSRQVSGNNRKNFYKNLYYTQDEIALQALK